MPSHRCVRQGCPLAPSLWVLITVALLKALAHHSSQATVQDVATVFADDLLLQWEFTSVPELDSFLLLVARCLLIMQRLGLDVQHKKTNVMISCRGRQAKQWLARHTARTPDGRYLVLPRQGSAPLHLPIVTSITYLGIVLCCGDFAAQTLAHRLRTAEIQRARLLKVLHSKSIPMHRRLQLWQACVCSSALYGLHVIGLRQKQIDRLTQVLVKHVRAITRSFAHMTKESSFDLLSRVRLSDPLTTLQCRCAHTLTKALQSQDPMVRLPAVRQGLQASASSLAACASHLTSHTPFTPGDEDRVSKPAPAPLQGAAQNEPIQCQDGLKPAVFACTECHLWFADLSALKKHRLQVHEIGAAKKCVAQEHRQHSANGMPECRHCGKNLVTWLNFCRHFDLQHCSKLWLSGQTQPPSANPQPPTAPHTSPTQLLFLQAPLHEWLGLARRPEVGAVLRQFCVLCGQWIANISSLKLHVSKTHPTLYKQFGKQATATCAKVGHVCSPCRYCGKAISRTDVHCSTCPVLWQARLCALLSKTAAAFNLDSGTTSASWPWRSRPRRRQTRRWTRCSDTSSASARPHRRRRWRPKRTVSRRRAKGNRAKEPTARVERAREGVNMDRPPMVLAAKVTFSS